MASLCASSSVEGRNSCSGGSSSRTVTGSPSIAARMAMKSSRWTSAQLLERSGLLGRRLGQDHPAHDGQAILAEEHVLGAAQADALRAELACVGRIVAGVGVGPDGQVALADLVGPGEDRGEGGRRRRRRERHLTRRRRSPRRRRGRPSPPRRASRRPPSPGGRPGAGPRRRRRPACPSPAPRPRRG